MYIVAWAAGGLLGAAGAAGSAGQAGKQAGRQPATQTIPARGPRPPPPKKIYI